MVSMPTPVERPLSLEATRQFQEIWQKEFGALLSDDEAQHKGIELLQFFDLLARPDGDPVASPRYRSVSFGGRTTCDLKCR